MRLSSRRRVIVLNPLHLLALHQPFARKNYQFRKDYSPSSPFNARRKYRPYVTLILPCLSCKFVEQCLYLG